MSAVQGISNTANGAAQDAMNMQQEHFQTAMYARNMAHQQQMALKSTAFDEMMDQQAENMREINTLRDVQMQQRKADDAITKKFIESITE